MNISNYNTEHVKGKHLTYEDCHFIQIRLNDGWSANRIAVEELNCSPNTVRNIIRNGMVPLYNGKVQRFKAKAAWKSYQSNRSRCNRHYDALEKRPFLRYVEKHLRKITGPLMHVPDVRWWMAASPEMISFAQNLCTPMSI